MVWRQDSLETVACDLCGGRHHGERYRRLDGLTLVTCSDCDLTFLNPRPHEAELGRIYSREYFDGDNAIGYTSEYSSHLRQPALRRAARRRLNVVAKHLMHLPRGFRALEVGCATGELCQELLQTGAEVTGYDVSAHAIEVASLRYPGPAFRCGDLLSHQTPETYHVIFAFELVEHLPSPSRFIEHVMRLLEPGGLFVLSTPNLECGEAVGLDQWAGTMKSFEHLYFLDPDHVDRYVRKAGGMTVCWYTGGGDGRVRSPKTPRSRDTLRRKARSMLSGSQLLSVAVDLYDRVGRRRQYRPGGRQHNLIHVSRRRI